MSNVFGSGGRCPTCQPAWPTRLRDYLQATDPALARLRTGWRMLVVFAATLAVGYGMAHALRQPSAFGLTYGGMVGMLVGLTVADPKPGRLAIRCVWSVPVFLLALLCAIELHPYRIPALIMAAAAAVVQLSAPALPGQYGVDAGFMVLPGFLCGILVPLPISKMQYIAPIVVVAAVAAAVVQVAFCRMRPATGLVHIERGFLAHTRYVVRRATRLAAADEHIDRTTRALSNAMIHLNEAAMLMDGYLATSGCPARVAAHLHRLVFDTELAANALGRTVIQLRRRPLPDEIRPLVTAALTDLDHGGRQHDGAASASTTRLLEWPTHNEDGSHDPDRVHLASTLHRFATIVGDLHRASDAWAIEADDEPTTDTDEPFTTPVELVVGRLPGADLLAGRVLASGGMRRPWNVWGKPVPQLRIAAQMLITLAIAIPLGDALNGYRFYWALIGALIVMVNTHSPHDRVRKTLGRVLGTLIGGFIGVGVTHLLGIGHPMTTLTLLCVVMAVGAYSISTYYSIWAGALAFSLIQLYSFTGGYQDSVVLLRAAENALGAVIATLVALVILPIATRTLLRHAQARHIHSLATFVRESGEVWSGSAGADGTRGQARAVDQAAHELHRLTRSLVRVPGGTGHERAEEIRSTLRRAAVCAREMSTGSGEAMLSATQRMQLLTITDNLSDSIDDLAEVVSDDKRTSAASLGPWVHRADDIRRLQAALSISDANANLRHALHYLGCLDGVLGELAARLDIPVQGRDYRTVVPAPNYTLFALHTQPAPLLTGVPAPVPGRAGAVQAWPTVDASAHGGDSRWIGGCVRGRTGHPVPGAVLTLIDRQGHRISHTTGRADGSYRIDLPTTGNCHYVLIVTANGYGPVAVTVSTGSGPQQDITLPGSSELSGVVYRDEGGEPIIGATVTLTDVWGDVVAATVTRTDGAYSCRGLTAGRYTMAAHAQRMRPIAITVVIPENGRLHRDIDLTAT